MDPRIFLFVLIGLGLALSVGLQRWLSRIRWLSLPIIYVAIGFIAFSLPLGLPDINPARDKFDSVALEYATEFIMIVSLMAAGIAIDRKVTWPNWKQVWPLLLITMPLTIALVALWSWWVIGLVPAGALLLGAVLAPTDPVFARSVLVGPPGEDERHDIRFSLSVEAGLNDSLAFPFTFLAIAAVGMTSLGGWSVEWLLNDLVLRVLLGLAVGYFIGRAAAWYVFERHAGDADKNKQRSQSYTTSEGLIVLGGSLLAYGVAEVVHGYGFLAVFVAAVTTRQRENRSEYHKISHHFIDQIEKIVLVIMMFAFGGMLAKGVLAGLSWPIVIMAVLLVFVIRPVTGFLGEMINALPWPGKLTVAFLGARGVGSIYYLAYAQNHGEFQQLPELWAGVSFTILLSIVIHGLTAGQLLWCAEKADAHRHEDSGADIPVKES
ncbi:cation:proton antiporter [Altericroceibacterium indicum]|uniref:cation:proton antiporter n=1 Tax=Altericroceibacterium indicum TaxID=374177 RepID=UPI0031B5D232